MEILLDTCTFLWWALGDPHVPPATAALLREPANRVYLSAASAWEIAVKHARGRLRLPEPPTAWVPFWRARYRLEALAVDETDALHVGKLPAIHRDPFDRILVAQALVRGWPIATPDPAIHAYPCQTIWPA